MTTNIIAIKVTGGNKSNTNGKLQSMPIPIMLAISNVKSTVNAIFISLVLFV